MGRSTLLRLGLVTSVLGTVVVGVAGSAGAVSGAAPADPAALPFLAKVQVSDQRACSGTLVSPQWVLTTRSCLAEPGSAAEGPPPAGTKVTLIGGTTDIVTLVKPHPERDLALLRLAKRTRGIATASIATPAPAAGAELRAAGFGRTASEWVPQNAHLGSFTVDSVTPATLTIDSADATLCLGDTGAPLLTAGGAVAAVASASWQGGCLGETETRRGGVAQRVDDLAAWVAGNTPSCKSPGTGMVTSQQTSISRLVDFTGDCNADLAGQFKDGNLKVAPSTGDVSGDLKAYLAPVIGRGGFSTTAVQRTITGDFNGDGLADVGAQLANGELWFYSSTGDTSSAGKLFSGPNFKFGTGWDSGNVEKIFSGDFNGDGVADLGAEYKNGGILKVWLFNRSTTTIGSVKASKEVGSNWGPANVDRFFIGDVNGDGMDDLIPQYKAAPQVFGAFAATGTFGPNDRWFAAELKTLGSNWGTGNVARIVVDDFNGDGVDDIGGQYVSGEMRVWFRGRNWDTLGFSVIGTGWGATNVGRILIGDTNGDGRAEVLANYVANTSEWGGDVRIYWVGGGATRRAVNDWNPTDVPRIL